MLAQVKVGGMTCHSCVNSVTAALQGTAGVVDAKVELLPHGRAWVKYDPHTLNAQSVLTAIEDAGFEAALEAIEDAASELQAVSTPDTIDGRAFTSSQNQMQQQALLSSVSTTPQPSSRAHKQATVLEKPAYSFSSTKSGDTLLDSTESVDMSGSHISTQFEVHGMTCSSCVASIERGLSNRKGIHSVSVSLLAQRATVEHDSNMVSDVTIAGWIEDMGFEAKPLDVASRVAKVCLNVYGMTCASCVALIERAVRKELGVVSVSVSLALETAVVEYRPSEIGVRKLVAVVEGAGFDVLVAESTRNNTQLESLQRTKDILDWKTRLIRSLYFSIPVIFLAKIAPHME
ncbi:Cu(2+)-transporting P-type ATPase, partial [Coemansia brasiliensis]